MTKLCKALSARKALAECNAAAKGKEEKPITRLELHLFTPQDSGEPRVISAYEKFR